MDLEQLKARGRSLPLPENYFFGFGSIVPPIPQNLLLFYRSSKSRLQVSGLHHRSHHRFVLMFNLGTSGRVNVDHALHWLHPGELLLVFPFQFHHYRDLSKPDVDWLFLTFELDESERHRLEPLRHSPRPLTREVSRLLCRVLDLYAERPLPGDHLQLAAASLVMELLRTPSKRGGNDPEPSGEGDLLAAVNRQLLSSTGLTPRIFELARMLNLSEGRLRTKFRIQSGVSLGRYIRNFQINRSMGLLCRTSLSVTEVADACGFASVQSFCRLFRQLTGRTPREYARNPTA